MKKRNEGAIKDSFVTLQNRLLVDNSAKLEQLYYCALIDSLSGKRSNENLKNYLTV